MNVPEAPDPSSTSPECTVPSSASILSPIKSEGVGVPSSLLSTALLSSLEESLVLTSLDSASPESELSVSAIALLVVLS